VANLRVDDVMSRRKDAIAAELLTELAPVLDGRGRVDDSTSMGWGVVIDTVEIQDVRVLSEEVFANMQAGYRAELAARARQAQIEREASVAASEAALRAAASEQHEAERRAEAERREAERRTELECRGRLLEAQAQLDAREHVAALVRLEQQAVRRRTQAADDQAHEDAVAEAQARLRRRQLDLDRLAGELGAALALAQRRVEDTVSPERIQLELVTRALPALAQAFAQSIGELRVTQIGSSGDDPTAWLTRGMAQVIEVARTLGLRLPGLEARAEQDD
jgi:hypothetical protein